MLPLVEDYFCLVECFTLPAIHLHTVLFHIFHEHARNMCGRFSARKSLISYVWLTKNSLNLRDSRDYFKHGYFEAVVMPVGVLDDLDLDVRRQRAKRHVHLEPLLQHALHINVRRFFSYSM